MIKRKFIYILLLSIFISSCGKNKKDLIENYEENLSDIIKLKEYYSKIVPDNYLVRIRYDSSEEIDLFVYQPIPNSNERELLFQQWNLNIYNYKPKSRTEYDKKYNGKTNSFVVVKEKLNWTNETFIKLYEKLENVNCIGITNRNPTEIEFGYKGMGVYSYLIFDENLNKKQQKKYTDYCSQLFYKDNVVLLYGSGAIGSLCTPDFKKMQ